MTAGSILSVSAANRQAWVTALRLARALALGVERGSAAEAGAVMDLVRALRGLSAKSFPSRGEASAQHAALAFLDLAQAFVLAAPPRRPIFAPALAAAAKALDDVVDELRTEAANHGWAHRRDLD